MADIDDAPVLDDDAWAWGERYWRELVDEILVSLGQAGAWPSSEPRFYGDGTTPIEREYRSICDGRSERLDRSFSIRQFPQGYLTAEISAFVKDYETGLLDFPDITTTEDANRWFEGVPPRERVPRSTLIINLEYSEETAARARSLLAMWLRPETGVVEMVAFIEQTPGVD